MDAIFMNSEKKQNIWSSQTITHLLDKISLKRSDKYLALSNLAFVTHGKI